MNHDIARWKSYPPFFSFFFFSSFLPFPFLGCPRYQIATILIRQHINLDYITITILSSSDQGKSKITKEKKKKLSDRLYSIFLFFPSPADRSGGSGPRLVSGLCSSGFTCHNDPMPHKRLIGARTTLICRDGQEPVLIFQQ